ncbi:hypothetical protein PGT21_017197 [Puccinia graminis f. sp. tritici]|uniref:Uncharacterized protein n=1 Tax=Puccinia graminis f. sp. tritici TaxID=56615 RepID=A0A5B0MUW9_PUCGR|nr:hypothetical protein PGT21_017197 [Puccinia graminis f. sp. tritici]KAA1092043.1 hypothetical protein PGTUg99_005187 [Puccinia graminis f. sp. tritici]
MSITGFETLTDAAELLLRCCQPNSFQNPIVIHTSELSKHSSQPTSTDAPADDDLQIPGGPILCKAKAKDEYWPAYLLNYLGLRRPKSETSAFNPASLSEKYYLVQFFDGTSAEVPRSFFFTSIESDFRTIKVGRIYTTEMKYKQFLPKLISILPDVDAVLAGEASDDSVRRRHQEFLQNQGEGRFQPHEDIIYGQYSDHLLYEVAAFLTDRYFKRAGPLVGPIDPRIFQLSENQKLAYISDVILPEVLVLVTIKDVVQDASTPVLNPRAAALNSLKTPDIVDLVKRLRGCA